jgi:sortase A
VSFTTVRVTIGRVVLVGGILILLFIPYLLWGTGLQTARSQSRLREEFAATQRKLGLSTRPHPIAPHRGPTPLEVAPPLPDPPLGSAVGTIAIPKIGLSMVLVEGTGTAQLEAGPGHYPATPLPGEVGNVAIAGHRTTYLHPFYNLNELVPGDAIVIDTVQGFFLYQVLTNMAVSPTDVAVALPTPTPTLTLTTCNPRYSAAQRLVVHAALVGSVLADHTSTTPNPSQTATEPPADVKVLRHQTPVVPKEPNHDWAVAILWGLAVAIITIAVWWSARRSRAGQRALILVVGVAAWALIVFYFFGAVAPLLPASF